MILLQKIRPKDFATIELRQEEPEFSSTKTGTKVPL
jgi:hypothetical protein